MIVLSFIILLFCVIQLISFIFYTKAMDAEIKKLKEDILLLKTKVQS